MSDVAITVQTDADWKQLHDNGIRSVVDPMVFRSADVFLRGASAASSYPGTTVRTTDPSARWKALQRNIGSLCTFIDMLILEERLAMYDYGITFPADLHEGRKTLAERCNSDGLVLIPVQVQRDAYNSIKEPAVQALMSLPSISAATATEICGELTAFDYEWSPDLGSPDEPGTQDELLRTFRFGGLLFSGYAQRLGADHIVQPGREKVYLAASLCPPNPLSEAELFAGLDRIAKEVPDGSFRTGDLPPTPTFLPYLLSKDPPSPDALIDLALKLRRSGMVKDYRAWRRDALDDLAKGRISRDRKKAIDGVCASLEREFNAPNIEAKISAKVGILGPELGAEAGIATPIRLGWLLQHIPGRRYLKLLARLTTSQLEYRQIDRHLAKLWRSV